MGKKEARYAKVISNGTIVTSRNATVACTLLIVMFYFLCKQFWDEINYQMTLTLCIHLAKKYVRYVTLITMTNYALLKPMVQPLAFTYHALYSACENGLVPTRIPCSEFKIY